MKGLGYTRILFVESFFQSSNSNRKKSGSQTWQGHLSKSNGWFSSRSTHHLVTFTIWIITLLLGNPYKPSFSTGIYIYCYWVEGRPKSYDVEGCGRWWDEFISFFLHVFGKWSATNRDSIGWFLLIVSVVLVVLWYDSLKLSRNMWGKPSGGASKFVKCQFYFIASSFSKPTSI